MEEIWKPIAKDIVEYSYLTKYRESPKFVKKTRHPETIYEVSSFGRIRKKNAKRCIAPDKSDSPTSYITLRTMFWDGTRPDVYVIDKIVYNTFFGDPGLHSIKHKDGNHKNNNIDNLYI